MLHRPKKPSDPRIHRHSQSPPPAADEKETAVRSMGFNSYIIEHVVRKMSQEGRVDFIAKTRYGMALIKELQVFLNEKYCHEEHMETQEHYGQLCNIAAYPACYAPYEMDMPARQTEEEERWRRTPHTFYQREFGGSVFPVYMTEEEYDSRFFMPHDYSVEDQQHPRGFYTYTKYPNYPANRMLCRRTSDGNIKHIRNMPMTKE